MKVEARINRSLVTLQVYVSRVYVFLINNEFLYTNVFLFSHNVYIVIF